MKVFTRDRAAYALSLVLCAVLLLAMALPAAAAKPAGKGTKAKSQKPAKAETTQVTEDNDTNDGDTPNNVVDDGDNKHPSGKDKSVENGGSGNQGNSTSDPDDDGRGPDRSNGGADKPDGPGGVDLADQDGNNGCGNDDDFEDDNEGWCGGKPKPAKAAKPAKARASESKSDEDSCMVSHECTPDVPASCDVASGECASSDNGTCDSTDATECTTDKDVADTESPSVVDRQLDTGDEALASEGQVEGETDTTDVAGVTFERSLAARGTGRVLGQGAAAGGLAAVRGAAGVLAATGAPMIVLGLLALTGMGLGAGILRRTRRK